MVMYLLSNIQTGNNTMIAGSDIVRLSSKIAKCSIDLP